MPLVGCRWGSGHGKLRQLLKKGNLKCSCDPAVPLLGMHPGEKKTVHIILYTSVLSGIFYNNQEGETNPSVHRHLEELDKVQPIDTMEYNSATKGSGVRQAAARMALDNTLSERSQTQRPHMETPCL